METSYLTHPLRNQTHSVGSLLKPAEQYFQDGRYDVALQAIKNVSNDYRGDKTNLFTQFAERLIESELFETAYTFIQEIKACEPYQELTAKLADKHLKRANYPLGFELAKGVLNPEARNALFAQIVHKQLEDGDKEGALETIDMMFPREGTKERAFCDLAQSYLDEADYSQAFKVMHNYYHYCLPTDQSQALMNDLSRACLEGGDFKQALYCAYASMVENAEIKHALLEQYIEHGEEVLALAFDFLEANEHKQSIELIGELLYAFLNEQGGMNLSAERKAFCVDVVRNGGYERIIHNRKHAEAILDELIQENREAFLSICL